MQKSFYMHSGNIVKIVPGDSMDITSTLGNSSYVLKYNQLQGYFFLEKTENFTIPSKIYGSPIKQAERVVRTFKDRPKQTGVLLSGDKGSGKTLLTKMIAEILRKEGCAVIMINEPHCGTTFNQFISSITEPAVIIFDEFDKTYDEEQQQSLLTLLDGTSETKKLFLLTANSGHIDEHLLNRPGRIYYKLEYDGLTEEFINEYVSDVLIHKEREAELLRVLKAFEKLNFDMIQAIVEEINRYNEDPKQLMHMLNVNIRYGNENVYYDVECYHQGRQLEDMIRPCQLSQNPIDAYYEPCLMFSEKSPFREKYGDRLYFDRDDFRADRLEICGGGVYKAIATTAEGDQFEFRFIKRKLKEFDIRAF